MARDSCPGHGVSSGTVDVALKRAQLRWVAVQALTSLLPVGVGILTGEAQTLAA